MTRVFLWYQKVKFANLQLPNVMLKDRDFCPIYLPTKLDTVLITKIKVIALLKCPTFGLSVD